MENKVLAEPLLQPRRVHAGADMLYGIENIDPALHQLRDQGKDSAISVVKHLLPVAVDQVAPVLQPGLEECLPRFEGDQQIPLHPHVVADEYDVNVIVQFLQEPLQHDCLDRVDAPDGGVEEFRVGYSVHQGILQATHLAIYLEMRDPRPDGGEVMLAGLPRQSL